MPSNVVLWQGASGEGRRPAINTVIPFSTPIPQVAGQQYAILVDYPEAPPFVNGIKNTGILEWVRRQRSTRPGPCSRPSTTARPGSHSPSEGFDLHFQTFVIPN